MEKLVYLYQHVPKCGGRSFVRACSSWFPAAHEQIGSYPNRERIAEFARTRLDFDKLPPSCFVHGHYVRDGIRPHERYGDMIAAGRCRLLTIVRDPLDRCVSAYFHARRIGRECPEPLSAWLHRGRNRTAKMLGMTEANWEQRLGGYFLVGLTESLKLTMDVLAAKTGNIPEETPHLNSSPRGDLDLDNDHIERFRDKNTLDYRIFEYAKERLSREAETLGLA